MKVQAWKNLYIEKIIKVLLQQCNCSRILVKTSWVQFAVGVVGSAGSSQQIHSEMNLNSTGKWILKKYNKFTGNNINYAKYAFLSMWQTQIYEINNLSSMNTYLSSGFLIIKKIPGILMKFWLFHSLHCTVVILSSLKGRRVETKIFLLWYQLLRSVIFFLSSLAWDISAFSVTFQGLFSVDQNVEFPVIATFLFQNATASVGVCWVSITGSGFLKPNTFPEIFTASWRLQGCRMWMSALLHRRVMLWKMPYKYRILEPQS